MSTIRILTRSVLDRFSKLRGRQLRLLMQVRQNAVCAWNESFSERFLKDLAKGTSVISVHVVRCGFLLARHPFYPTLLSIRAATLSTTPDRLPIDCDNIDAVTYKYMPQFPPPVFFYSH